VLLAREVTDEGVAWNREHHAPFGRRDFVGRVGCRVLDRVGLGTSDLRVRLAGPFSLQGNSDTRVVEYPWAFQQVGPRPGLEVVEVGGALSGFQFALSKAGCTVTNVDPGEDDQEYWELAHRLNTATIDRLNKLFGTSVTFRGCLLQEAGIAADSVDRVVSVSTIEHIPPEGIEGLVAEIRRILRPGGRCVLTIDLFLDLHPFTDKRSNLFGTNIDVRALVEASGLELVEGDPRYLVGYDEFVPREVQAELARFFIGAGYPVCAQALVLAKS
jgi:SAM-dependent methyltransferase